MGWNQRRVHGSLYTESRDVLQCFETLVFLFGFEAIAVFSYGLLSCLMRLTNNTAVFSQQAFVYCTVMQFVLSYIFCLLLDMKAIGIVISNSIINWSLVLSNLYVIFKTDWISILH